MKKNIIQLVLSIICFLIVFIGCLLSINNNYTFNIVLCTIIFIAIIVQIIAILSGKPKK